MNENGRVPERETIDDRWKWDLSTMYDDAKDVEADMEGIRSDISGIHTFRGKLNDAEIIAEVIRSTDELSRRLEKVFTYAHLMHDSDLRKTEFQKLHDMAVNLMVHLETETSFIIPEILELPDDMLEGLPNMKSLVFARVPLRDILRRKAHFLSMEEEKLLAMADDALETPSRAYTMLNDADLEFPVIRNSNGEDIELSHGRYMDMMTSRDREVRKRAFKAFHSSYASHINTFAALLEGELKKRRFYSGARKYPSSLEASLDADEVSGDVYDSLIEAVRSHLPSMYRYLDVRRRALNIDQVHMYDVHATLVPEFDRKIKYEDAWEIVLSALSPLGSEVREILLEARDGRWIDVYENRGKRSGGYSSGCYDSPPYILLNYQEKLIDVFTLAHELGHSVHTYLANRNQPHLTADYRIFVAEVASTVNENLLLSHLSGIWTSADERTYLTNHHLDSFKGTVFRQTMFAQFEKDVASMVEKHVPITAEGLSETYESLVREYFGPSTFIDKEIRLEWARIPHFYYNFYVYKYATGFSAASAISEGLLDGSLKVNDYLDMLKAGGSEPPLELLKRVGLDLTKPSAVNRGLDLFDSLVSDLDGMI